MSDVSESDRDDHAKMLVEMTDKGQIRPWMVRHLLARIEALEARNYQYSRELDAVLLRIRDDYHSTDH